MKFINSIKFKLLLLMLCIALIPLVGISIFQLNQFNKTITENIRSQEMEIVFSKADQMNIWVNSKISQVTGMIKAHPEFVKMDKTDIDAVIRPVIASDPELEGFAAIDKDGNAINIVDNKPLNLSERDYFKKARDSRDVVVADIVTSKATGNKVITVAVPQYDGNNFHGVIFNQANVKSLENYIGKVKIAQTGYAFMLSKDGNVIFHSDANFIGKSVKEISKTEGKLKFFTDEVLAKNEGFNTYKNDDGTDMIATFSTVPITGWKVVATVPSKEVYAETNKSEIISLIIIVSVALLVILISIILVTTFTKPIKYVVGMIQEMKNGHLKQRLRMNRKDEFGILAKNMDDFADDLQNVLVKTMYKISEGDLNVDIENKDNDDEITPALRKTVESIKGLNQEINNLTTAAINGDLKTRGNTERFTGAYCDIITGVNNTLDKILEPINESSEVLNEISKGNLQVRVKGDYKGEHAFIKNSLNSTIESLNGYINEIRRVLTEMSVGNLDISITNKFKGDFIEIENALSDILFAFNEIIGDINGSANQVLSASRQISNSAQALSQSSTEQASSIEELTVTVQMIAEQTKNNASNAGQASEYAVIAKEQAVDGNSQMKEMLKSMEDINRSSGDISKIIKVIDEIAFQTNILALNAAVEAARAGQHGKGFAVVAEEVRNLASRSAEAARETADLIEGSIFKVNEGTKIANNTAVALDKIVAGVSKVTSLVGDIAMASNEQATGIAQVNQGINQISVVIQNNSATSEESAASSEELSSQAEVLNDMVSKFKTTNKSIHQNHRTDELDQNTLNMLPNGKEKKRTRNKNNNTEGISSGVGFDKY